MEKQVAAALRRAGYSGTSSVLVVAVSGGADSSALLYCLHRLKEPHGLRLHVAHLNHDFRGEEADEDARYVAALARELELECTVEKQDPARYQQQRGISSFEQAAREMRYAFLATVAKEVGACAVAVGHTADDQAETVLQHLLRGSGLHGLRGMAELSPWPWPKVWPELRLFRPLLGVAKEDTVAYCRSLGRRFREDSGNYHPEFTRNRVRHRLLPMLASEYNPQVRGALLRLARTVALDLEFLEGEVTRAWPQIAEVEGGAIEFNLPALALLHPALQRMLLRRGYSVLMGDTRRLREDHLNAMAGMVAAPASGRGVDLPGQVQLRRNYDILLMSRIDEVACPFPTFDGEHALVVPSAGGQEVVYRSGGWRLALSTVEVSPPFFAGEEQGATGHRWTAWLDWASLGGRLSLRTRRPGDRFRPLGMGREKKLQDFFTDAKVPRGWRDRVPLLIAERGIAWVAGYRIADWARIDLSERSTRLAVRAEFVALDQHG